MTGTTTGYVPQVLNGRQLARKCQPCRVIDGVGFAVSSSTMRSAKVTTRRLRTMTTESSNSKQNQGVKRRRRIKLNATVLRLAPLLANRDYRTSELVMELRMEEDTCAHRCCLRLSGRLQPPRRMEQKHIQAMANYEGADRRWHTI